MECARLLTVPTHAPTAPAHVRRHSLMASLRSCITRRNSGRPERETCCKNTARSKAHVQPAPAPPRWGACCPWHMTRVEFHDRKHPRSARSQASRRKRTLTTISAFHLIAGSLRRIRCTSQSASCWHSGIPRCVPSACTGAHQNKTRHALPPVPLCLTHLQSHGTRIPGSEPLCPRPQS